MDGLNGWQGLFLAQGLPATILGVVAYFYRQDEPEQALWLNNGEKRFLHDHLEQDQGRVDSATHGSLRQMLRDPKVSMRCLAVTAAVSPSTGSLLQGMVPVMALYVCAAALLLFVVQLARTALPRQCPEQERAA